MHLKNQAMQSNKTNALKKKQNWAPSTSVAGGRQPVYGAGRGPWYMFFYQMTRKAYMSYTQAYKLIRMRGHASDS